MDHHDEEDEDRLDLKKRLMAAIQAQAPQLTQKQAKTVVALRLAVHDHLEIDVEGELWAAVAWGKELGSLRGARARLDPISQQIYEQI